MNDGSSRGEEQVLIFAPTGKDAGSIATVMAAEKIDTRICNSAGEVCREFAAGASVLLVTEEALFGSESDAIYRTLDSQPPWSDLPVIVLTSGGEEAHADLRTRRLKSIGNVSLLERPLRAITLISAVKVALRNRGRQYQTRELLKKQVQGREEAERLNRLKDDFLTTLSHELRTPLTPLLGWTKLLLKGTLSSAESQRALTIIERNVKAQGQLIDDLLDISRVVTGKMRLNLCSINIVKVVEAAIDVVRPAAEAKRLKLETLLPGRPVMMTGDGDRLQQVFWNLLTNAVKFTPAYGTITVEVDELDESVFVRVRDTGVGIAREFLPRLFERFSQADSTFTRSYSGLGIGLSLVRSLLELHCGSVAGDSTGHNMGSTFSVTLPLRQSPKEFAELPPAHALNAATELHKQPELRGIRILIVDDEPDSRDMLSVALSQSGAEVTSAGSVREAMLKFRAEPPNILVSDLGMPGEDGFDLIRQVRALENSKQSVNTEAPKTATRLAGHIPAIALTAYARDEDRSRCLVSGFQRHIAKPIEPSSLVNAVAELMQTLPNAHEE